MVASPFTVPQTLEPVASDKAKPKGEWSQRFGIPKETGSFDYTLRKEGFWAGERQRELQSGVRVSYSRVAMYGGRAEELSMNTPFAGGTVLPETGRQTRAFGLAPSPTMQFGDIVSFRSTVGNPLPELTKTKQ